ncbi:unnamed protein product, partial [Prunus brigantina]
DGNRASYNLTAGNHHLLLPSTIFSFFFLFFFPKTIIFFSQQPSSHFSRSHPLPFFQKPEAIPSSKIAFIQNTVSS